MLLGRVPAAGEPLWLGEDRARALSFIRWQRDEQADLCGRCGSRESDWLDEFGHRRDTLEASATKCFGCEEIASAWARIRGEPEGDPTAGLRVHLRPASGSEDDPLGGFAGIGAR